MNDNFTTGVLFQYGGRRRLSGTTSELNMTRIGTSEKVKVLETLEGVTSLPVELTRGIRGQVKPDRDKIRTILGMYNVIELQRHLLTTVMENEVCNNFPVSLRQIDFLSGICQRYQGTSKTR